jgi:HlyD family secretion protein
MAKPSLPLPGPAKKKHRVMFGLLVLALLGIGLYFAKVAWQGKTVAVVRPKRGELVEKVVTTGRVLAQARIQLGSMMMAQVAKVKVDEGDRVRAGDLLVQFQDHEQSAAVAQARAAIARAKVMVNRVSRVSRSVTGQKLDEAKSSLALAEQDYRRSSALSQAGALPEAQLEKVDQALKAAKNRYAMAEVELLSTQPGGSDHLGAAASVEEASAQLTLVLARMEQTRIVAPADGIVLTRNAEPGDVVRAGQILLVLARTGPTRLGVQVDEKDLAVLKLGQHGRALADALPDRPFDGTLSFIAPEVDADRGTIEVRLDVPAPPEGLRPDMTVSVNIELSRKKDVMLLPDTAIHDAKKAEPWVLVTVGGRAVRRKVELGARGDGLVEVKSGVAEQESVILPSADVEVGKRVNPVEKRFSDAL